MQKMGIELCEVPPEDIMADRLLQDDAQRRV